MANYPLTSSSWDDREQQALYQVIHSGRFTMGERVGKFEEEFAFWSNKKYSVMVNSGSSANLLMVAALIYSNHYPIKKGDQFLVPAVSWSTSYYPFYQYGISLRFVDIDPETLNFELNRLEEAISEKTKGILAVNLLGNPNYMEQLLYLAKKYDLALIEDNCEAIGATYGSSFVGSYGVMSTFSTFYSHHICTMEGGVVTTDSQEFYYILKSLRSHGWTRDLPESNPIASKSKNFFSESFRFVLPGYNVRPLEMSGAVGIEQLKKLPELLENRRLNAKKFKKIIQKFDWLRTQKEVGESSWFGFSLILEENFNLDREKVLKYLDYFGVEYRPIVAGNFVNNPVVKYMDFSVAGDLVNANVVEEKGFFVGNHGAILDDELYFLENALQSVEDEI